MLGKSTKRNTTPPGRRRPPAQSDNRTPSFSYYAQNRSQRVTNEGVPMARRMPLPQSKAEVLRFVGQRFGLLIAIVASAALLVSSLQVAPDPRLTFVNNTKVYRIHNDQTYTHAIERELKSSWQNSNKFTINSDKVSREVKKQYPELADVSLVLPVLGQRPIAYLQLTRPSLILVSMNGSAFVLDETGRVLASASQVSNLDSFHLPAVTDESGIEVRVGQLALTGPTVSFVRNVAYQLDAAHVAYNRLTIPVGTQELDVAFAGKPYIARFNTHDDDTARQQAGALLAVQANLQKKGTEPASYIDVRLPDRVYYK